MLKENIFLLILVQCLLPFSSVAQQNSFTVTGNIKGVGNDSVIIIINNHNDDGKMLKPDTLITKANADHFYLKGKAASIKNVWTAIGGFKSRNSFSFYLEPGNIKIEGEKDALSNLSITGTRSNDEQTKARRFTNSIYRRILLLRKALKNTTKGSAEYESIVQGINAKYDSIQAYELEYVKTHPNSFVSVTFLWVKQDKLPLDELERLYNGFTSALQKSAYGISIREKIKARKFVAIGNPAPDFVSTDTSGNPVRLSDFRGKYVLLEFWANWCVPCRAQSPHLVEMYKKYNDKGFTILQYSMDDKSAEQKWKAAIIKDGLVWTQVSDLNGFESKVAKLYGVQPIPDNFLIDPNGVIIGRRVEGKELEEKLETLLK